MYNFFSRTPKLQNKKIHNKQNVEYKISQTSNTKEIRENIVKRKIYVKKNSIIKIFTKKKLVEKNFRRKNFSKKKFEKNVNNNFGNFFIFEKNSVKSQLIHHSKNRKLSVNLG